MVPCFHQSNLYMKRKLRVWRAQKCISLVGAETPLTCAGRQTTPFHGGRYRSQNGNLHRLGRTYCHGIVFAPRHCLYQKKATGMDSPEMFSTSRCINPTYLCGLANYPLSWWRYMAENINLRKLWCTYRHGTMFAPRHCLYQKKATGMERTEMYFTSWYRNPTYLCRPANFPMSWGAV